MGDNLSITKFHTTLTQFCSGGGGGGTPGAPGVPGGRGGGAAPGGPGGGAGTPPGPGPYIIGCCHP